KDPRYTRFVGKHAIRPLPAELPREKKLIPIIADDKVDFEFGTGVLKVTPAHDKLDFEIGQRHHLEVVDVMNPNGTMNELAGAGLRPLAGEHPGLVYQPSALVGASDSCMEEADNRHRGERRRGVFGSYDLRRHCGQSAGALEPNRIQRSVDSNGSLKGRKRNS